MKEYVKHIMHTHHGEEARSWCGEQNEMQMTWGFISLDHAAYNAIRGGRLLACPECVRAAVSALSWTTAQRHPEFLEVISEKAVDES